MLLARLLGGEDFGKLSIFYSSMLFLSLIVIFGATVPLSKEIAESNASNDKVSIGETIKGHFQTSLFIYFLFAIVFLSFYQQASYLLMNSLDLGREAFLFLLLFYSIHTIQYNILLGLRAYNKSILSSMGRSVLNFMPVAGFFFGGLDSSIVFMGLSYLFSVFLNHILLKMEYKEKEIDFRILTFPRTQKLFANHLKNSLPYFLGSIFVFPVTWLTNRMLISGQNGFIQLGVFNSIYQLRNIIVFLPNSLSSIFLPMMTATYHSKKFLELKKILKMFMAVSFLFGLGVNLVVILFTNQIVSYFGASFEIERELIYVVSFTNLLLTIQIALGVFLNSVGKMWQGFWANLLWAIILISSFRIILEYGLLSGSVSLSYSYLIAYVFAGVLLYFFMMRSLTLLKA